ncbi:MAG: sialate O-acetylesterase, partial [Verrucomicrobiales bacterium]
MKIPTFCLSIAVALAAVLPAGSTMAELKLSSIIGDNMVLQRDLDNVPIWGWADAGTEVTVEFAGQKVSGKAGDDGRWEVKLAKLAMSAKGQAMNIKAGGDSITLKDILVGEVWVCSGQSNMQWATGQAYDADLEALTANFPNIRLISVPQVGTQELQNDFKGQWEAANATNVAVFSAVGWYFGKQLSETLNIPIGLIDNAWGGSAAEAWVERGAMEADPEYAEAMAQWKKTEAAYDHDAAMAKWKAASEKAKAAGKNAPRAPRNQLVGQHRPGNLYAGVLNPIIGYGIKGAIWYQGESNTGRAFQYRKLFSKMITHWREKWGQGDFSFYWVSLADFKDEVDAPVDADWAVLRESQTATLSLPNTGEAIIYDIGEGRDIHP